MTTCTAAWSAPRLLEALARKGWGDLDGRTHAGLRKTLYALVSLLPHEAAEGRLTAWQVATAAGQSEKWTRHCLAQLEDRGLIVWRRGWLDHGKPKPGWIRICKTRLAEMIRSLRDALDDRIAAHRARTAHRVATTLHAHTIPPWKRHHPLSSRPELSSTLPAPTGRTSLVGGSPDSQTLPGLQGDPMNCQVCGKPQDQCLRANRRAKLTHRHRYQPNGHTPRHTLVAPATTTAPPAHQAPQGWRASIRSACRPPHPTIEGLQ